MLDQLWNLDEYSWEKIDPLKPPIKAYCCPHVS